MQQSIIVQHPGRLPENELSEFERIVVEGGEVQTYGLRERINNANRLAITKLDEAIAAIGAVKQPELGYRTRIFAKAKLAEFADIYKFEIGWIYVLPQFRGNGLSGRIVGALLDSIEHEEAYATSRATNLPMHSSLLKNDFRCAGEPYKSNLSDEDIVLFLRDRARSH